MEIYTLKELSKKLDIQYRTLVREVHRGNLRAIKKGGTFLVTEANVNAYQKHIVSVEIMKVGVAVVFKEDSLLIVKRKYPEGSLIWQCPSGLLRGVRPTKDEVSDICKKETNIDIKYIKKIGTRISPETKVHLTYLLCEYTSGDVRNLTELSNTEVKWIHKSDALKYFTSSVYYRLLEYFE